MTATFLYFVIPLAFLFSIPGLLSAWKEFQVEKTNREIEKTLPDVLLRLSSMPTSTHFQNILKEAASLNVPASVPFHHAMELISKGCPVQLAISKSFSRYSLTTQKSGELFSKLYTNGNSTLTKMGEFANELSKHNQVKESAKADLSMQKYSLLVSSAFLVPFIISLIHSISLKASGIISQPAMVSNDVILLAINIYLILFSFLAAKFISRQFNSHFITFFSITCPLSLLVFNVSSLFIS